MNFDRPVIVRDELIRIGKGMREDFRAVRRCVTKDCACPHCHCWKRDRGEGTPKRTQSSPAS